MGYGGKRGKAATMSGGGNRSGGPTTMRGSGKPAAGSTTMRSGRTMIPAAGNAPRRGRAKR